MWSLSRVLVKIVVRIDEEEKSMKRRTQQQQRLMMGMIGRLYERFRSIPPDEICSFILSKHGRSFDPDTSTHQQHNMAVTIQEHIDAAMKIIRESWQHPRLTLHYSDWYTEKMNTVGGETPGQSRGHPQLNKLISIPFTINHSSSRITSCLSCSGT